MLSVIALAASGVGIGAVSQCLQNMPIPGVIYRPISGAGRRAELAAVHRKNESNQLVRGFISTLRLLSKGIR
jgi:DNA-binding transcriptional LysR family regulator